MPRGERLLGAAFGALGLLWVVKSLDLTYMGDFAPGSGFLPLWLGIALVALSAIFLVGARQKAPTGAETAPPSSGVWRKTVPILLGLFVCVAVIGWLGFVVPVTAYMIFLIRYVERRSWLATLAVSLGTTLCLFLIFKAWLGVPFPEGPWGF